MAPVSYISKTHAGVMCPSGSRYYCAQNRFTAPCGYLMMEGSDRAIVYLQVNATDAGSLSLCKVSREHYISVASCAQPACLWRVLEESTIAKAHFLTIKHGVTALSGASGLCRCRR